MLIGGQGLSGGSAGHKRAFGNPIHDDIKWLIGGVTGLLTIIMSVIALMWNTNFNSEKRSLREFQSDLRKELGKFEIPPELELQGIDRRPLAGQEIPATFQQEGDKWTMTIIHLLKNVGESSSGLLYEKVYSKTPIELQYRSTDEQKFEYETYFDPKNLFPSQIPGNFSNEWPLTVTLKNSERPPPGKYPALIKVYYGKGKVVQARFSIVVSEQ